MKRDSFREVVEKFMVPHFRLVYRKEISTASIAGIEIEQYFIFIITSVTYYTHLLFIKIGSTNTYYL